MRDEPIREEEMGYERITAPGRLGSRAVKNRITLAPMEKNWCDRLGNPTQVYIDYYVERAKGGVGMMNFEATYVDPRGRGNLFQLGLWDDTNIKSHRRLNDAIHEFGALSSTELNHGGRNSATPRTGLQPVAPSAIPNEIVGGQMPKELTSAEIAGIVRQFAEGARRALAAGYDIITIHGAHGYLITSFLSPKFNQRTDEYGGSEEKRWRFPREVYDAIRKVVGPDFPVGMRISVTENVEGGSTLEQSVRFVQHMERAGLAFVDVSVGTYESIETLIQPMDIEQGCLLPYAKAVRDNVKIPVIAAGRINNMDLAERALAEGSADFVHMSRAFHADPEILEKTLSGRKDEVISCIACNKCCAELFVNKRSVCTVNPAAGREEALKYTRSEHSRRVMVIGGGLAGMEAAAVASERGHRVTLYEKNDVCGGIVLIYGASHPHRNWNQSAEDRFAKAQRAGVSIVTSREITLADIENERPDVVILATGTKPFMPVYVPGISRPIVTNYDEVVRRRVGVGTNVVVVGGQNIGLTVAEFLAEHGANVTVLEATGALANDIEYMGRKMLLKRVNESNRIKIRLGANIEEIGADFVVVQSEGRLERIEGVDQVVFALERDMERALVEELSGGVAERLGIELILVGDAQWPGEPAEAVLSGNTAGRAI